MRRLLATITLVLAVFAAPAGARAQALHPWTAEPAWISNTGVYRHHELVYQDYLYDDHGANTDGFDHQDLPFGAAGFDPRDPTNPRLSPAPIVNYAGDFMYAAPDGTHMDDVADLWRCAWPPTPATSSCTSAWPT